MSSDKNKLLTPHPSKLALRNKHCPYCLKPLESKKERTREHVIGRNFVPTGTLAGQWNLVLWACNPCNSEKSDLEDDISAISMLPELGTAHANDDPRRADTERKAKGSRSRDTGRPVKDSHTQQKISGSPMPGLSVSFDLVGPPQVDGERLFDLAHFHIKAFDYLTHFNHSTGIGGYSASVFAPVEATRPFDWGNERMQTFMDTVRAWETSLIAIGAREFFKVVIRRNRDEKVRSWALEYNKCFRIVGFLGEEDVARKFFESIPLLKMKNASADGSIRTRREVPLDPANDVLFDTDD